MSAEAWVILGCWFVNRLIDAWRWDRERDAWRSERKELLNRIQQPGKVPGEPTARRPARVWTDADEAAVEWQARARAESR